MKRRIIITVVAVMFLLMYQYLQPKSEDFTLHDLMKVRDSQSIDYMASDEDGVLVFWEQEVKDSNENVIGLSADYFKPGFGKWNWVNGGMHSGDYDTGVSYQYIPKKALKKFSLAFGVVVDSSIKTIKLSTDKDNITAQIIALDDKSIWYIRQVNNFTTGKITCTNALGEVVYDIDIDNSWLIE